MTKNLDDSTPVKNEENAPGHPILKFAVIFMGLLIVAGVAVIIVTVVKRTVGKVASDQPAIAAGASAVGDLALSLPKDAVILSHSLSGDRLSLHIQSPEGQKLLIFGLADGALIATITLRPE